MQSNYFSGMDFFFPDIDKPSISILHGDVVLRLRNIPDRSVHCVVTSPPYFKLRNYGLRPTEWPEVEFIPMAGLPPVVIPAQKCCLGLESQPLDFVGHIVYIFREVFRVLRDDGALWLNFGDSFAGNTRPGGDDPTIGKRNIGGEQYMKKHIPTGLKAKDMIGIPWRVAFALQADGWYLRMDNIWNKKNPLPESCTDRPTKSHEYFFLFSKQKKYFYDAEAIKTELSAASYQRLNQDIENPKGSNRVPGKTNGPMKAVGNKGYDYRGKWDNGLRGHSGNFDQYGNLIGGGKANKKSVWDVNTVGYKGAHYATFPPKLVAPAILAGTSQHGVCDKCGAPFFRVLEKNGGWMPMCKCENPVPVPATVLDPFAGTSTTGFVSVENGRKFIGIELSEESIRLSIERLKPLMDNPKLF